MIVEPSSTTERKIRAGKEYKISNVESIEGGAEIETQFQLEGLPATISCFADYPNVITIGELMDSFQSFGINLNVLDIAEPVDL